MTTPPRLFDAEQLARNLARRSGPDNFVRDLVLEDLADRLSTYKRDFARAVLIGPDAGTLPQTLATANGPVNAVRVEAFAGEEFPARHAWLVTGALAGHLPASKVLVASAGPELPIHEGSRAYLAGAPQPD